MSVSIESKIYLDIIFVLWKLIGYYENLFKLETPSNATKLPVRLSMDGNITHLIIEVPSTRTPDPYYTGDAMKAIFNEYLNIVLLPEQNELKPFSGGKSIYDIVDCLYVYEAYVLTTGFAHIDVIFVDNMEAFQFVKADNRYLTM